MRTGGMALIALGVLALIYGGINYSKDRTVLEVGSMNVTATEQKRLPVPAVAGVVLVLGGVGLLFFGARMPRRA